MLIPVLVLIAVVAYAAGWRPNLGYRLAPSDRQYNGADNAKEVLAQRYSRGDISREEYLRAQADIG